MTVMNAVAWCGIMFLLAAILRAVIKPLGRMVIPSAIIGGIIGCILMNTCGLWRVTGADFSPISTHMYTFLFINMGLTAKLPKKEGETKLYAGGIKGMRQRMGDSQVSGIVGMGAMFAVLYAVQVLLAMGIIEVLGKGAGMDPIYGAALGFGFAQGPGQAANFGAVMENYGWEHYVQVGIFFAAVGFVVSYIFGVPFARKGMRNGIAVSKTKMSESLMRGFYEPEEQESYGKLTTYGGNLDTMTFHIALVGLSWMGGHIIGNIWTWVGELVGSKTLSSTIAGMLFFNGMIAAYIIRAIVYKLGLDRYLDRGTQTRITNAATDLMVMSTFLSLNLATVSKWMLPMLVVCVAGALVTWLLMRYFGARFGGRNDFERTLAEFGTATGTNATGLSLVRIVDPNNETTTAAELGPSNAVNLPACLIIVPTIFSAGAGAVSKGSLAVTMALIAVTHLAFMWIVGCWTKKTYSMSKGEKYRDGKCYQRNGEPVNE